MIPFSFTGNAGSTLSHVVVPASGRDRIRVQYVNATSDKAASLLTFKSPSKSTVVTATSAANQTVINCVPYAGAAPMTWWCCSPRSPAPAFVAWSPRSQAGVSITLNANLGLALAPGDTVSPDGRLRRRSRSVPPPRRPTRRPCSWSTRGRR